MLGPALFKLGDTTINLAGTSASIGGMTSVGTSIIKSANDINGLTFNSGTSHHFITSGTEKMTITPGGSVGIGIDEPVLRTQIHGPVDNGPFNGDGILRLSTTAGAMSMDMGIAEYGTVPVYGCWIQSHTGNNVDTNHLFLNPTTGAGRVAVNSSSNPPLDFYVNGSAGNVTGNWSASDDRVKYNEEIISGVSSLAMINQLEPQYYEKIAQIPNGVSGNWIPTDTEWPSVKDNYKWINESGLIAQDVRAIPGLSFAVSGEEVDAEGTQTPLFLNYSDIYTYHIAATKELSSQLDDEKAKVADLLARVTALENP